MAKIVIQLQQDCLNDAIPCSSLLLKAYTIAMKLGMKDTAEIFSHELNGYKDVDKKLLPEYRHILVNLEAFEPYERRWIPVIFPPNTQFNKHAVTESVAEIEKIEQSNCDTIEQRLNTKAQKIIQNVTNMQEPMLVHQIYSAASMTSILPKVRKAILDWSLALESEGILGENLEFTTEERKIAKEAPSVQININGIVFGSNVSGILNDSISKAQSQGK